MILFLNIVALTWLIFCALGTALGYFLAWHLGGTYTPKRFVVPTVLLAFSWLLAQFVGQA